MLGDSFAQVVASLRSVLKTPAEVAAGSLLFLDMIDDLRLLYDRNGFFRTHLDGFAARLRRLGARRIRRDVELALKGALRVLGVEPPKIHDVGPLLLEYRDRLPNQVRPDADRIAEASRWLRKEREFSFYGEVDLIPTEEYGIEDAERALADARFVVDRARVVFASVRGQDQRSRPCGPRRDRSEAADCDERGG